jgi:COMPASS component SWD3
MSLESSPDPSRRSPKRRRTSSPGLDTPNYDGADDAKLSYAYDDDVASDPENAFPTPDHGSDEEDGRVKRRKVERPNRLNYVLHMTLRGHKRGVAAAKFSPDGKWIASTA